MENRIALNIPEDTINKALALLREVNGLLSPHLIALKTEERQHLPKMGDTNVPFVEKALEFAKSSPELVPPYMSVEDLKVDFVGAKSLFPLVNVCNQLNSRLDDTVLLSGSEAYVAALTFYNSAKMAAKNNVPGAKLIVDELGKRFVVRKLKAELVDAND